MPPSLRLLLPLLLLAAAPALAQVPLRVVLGEPTSKSGDERGAHAVGLILRSAGLSYTLSREPPERALVNFRAGRYDIDGARTADFDKAVPGAIRVEPALMQIAIRAFGRAGLPGPTAWADLALHRIAYVRGQRSVEYRLPPGQPAVAVTTPASCLGMAAIGRVDYCVIVAVPRDALQGTRVPLHGSVIERIPLHLWVGPGREALARALGEALRANIANGELARVLAAPQTAP